MLLAIITGIISPLINEISKFSAPTIAFLAFWLAKNSDYEPIVGVLRHMENSAPRLKIFRTKFSTSALYNGRNKNRQQNPVWEFTKTIIPWSDYNQLALLSTRAYGIIVI